MFEKLRPFMAKFWLVLGCFQSRDLVFLSPRRMCYSSLGTQRGSVASKTARGMTFPAIVFVRHWKLQNKNVMQPYSTRRRSSISGSDGFRSLIIMLEARLHNRTAPRSNPQTDTLSMGPFSLRPELNSLLPFLFGGLLIKTEQ